jgi:hypothetical protein
MDLPNGRADRLRVAFPDRPFFLNPTGRFSVLLTISSILKNADQSAMGHTIADTALCDVLLSRGYRLAANKKNSEGSSHADRDAQFTHIKRQCEQFEAEGNPIISVDCKKKELRKNNGREWQAKGEETSVNVYDFLSLADGKAIPYGIYDLVHNQGARQRGD